MSEILSQDEIDALLNAISSSPTPSPKISNLKEFGKYLIQKKVEMDKNSFENQNVNIFQGPHITLNKSLINNVYTQAVVKEPKAIVKLGNIEIIPINLCPSCNHYHYDEEVQEIYSTSNPSLSFITKNKNLKGYDLDKKWKTENRTICCKKCNAYFQPTIVYSESENSDPYLCKMQTIDTLDKWFLTERKAKIQLFSISTKTIVFNQSRTSLFWDIFLDENVNGMSTCPTGLLTNIARYTPLEHIPKLLNGEKRVPVFNSYDFKGYYKPTQVFKEV